MGARRQRRWHLHVHLSRILTGLSKKQDLRTMSVQVALQVTPIGVLREPLYPECQDVPPSQIETVRRPKRAILYSLDLQSDGGQRYIHGNSLRGTSRSISDPQTYLMPAGNQPRGKPEVSLPDVLIKPI